MRKIIVSEFVSLDGVMEGPGPDDTFKSAGWTMPYGSAQFFKFKMDELFSADALLLGRVTYEGFAKAWPGLSDESGFADRMNSLPKYVASTTLKQADWQNSTILSTNLVPALQALKQQPGQNILVFGSGMLVETLNEQKLVDEYWLLVYPLVLGSGKRLFKEGASANLTLRSAEALDKGVVLLKYQA